MSIKSRFLILFAMLVSAIPPKITWAGPQVDGPVLALHVTGKFANRGCQPTQNNPVQGTTAVAPGAYTVQWNTGISGPPNRPYVWLIVANADQAPGIGGISCGIEWQMLKGDEFTALEVAWTRCSDLEFPSGGWPASGGGNRISWTLATNCQRKQPSGGKVTACAGFFYLSSYYNYPIQSAYVRITEINTLNPPEAMVLDCASVETKLPLEALGWVAINPSPSEIILHGCNPYLGPCRVDIPDIPDTLSIGTDQLTSPKDTASVAIVHTGKDSIGVVSLFFDFDISKLSFSRLENVIPGKFLSAGALGGRVSVQWFDVTGGLDPILSSVDTLCVLRFARVGSYKDSTQITFDATQSAIGNPRGDPLTNVVLRDDPPYGVVTFDIPNKLSGRVMYYLMDRSVPGTRLTLAPPMMDVFTDALGAYAFTSIPFGNYTLRPSKGDDLLGINSLDAIKIVRHSTGIELFNDPNKTIAADVTSDGHVNSFDAIKIVRTAVGIDGLVSGNWRFLPAIRQYVPLNGDFTNEEFLAIRMGDVNGDWMPSNPGALGRLSSAALAARGSQTSLSLSLPDTTVGSTETGIIIPLRVVAFTGVGAVSLRITYDVDVLSYTSTASTVPGVIYTVNRVGNEIRLEWFDATGGLNPINLQEGILLNLQMNVIGNAGTSSELHFTSQCAIASAGGDPVAGVGYTDGRVRIETQGAVPGGGPDMRFELQPASPNPTMGGSVLRFSLTGRGGGTLSLFNARGRMVRRLFSADTGAAGAYTVIMDGKDEAGVQLAGGLYFLVLREGGVTQARKLVLLH